MTKSSQANQPLYKKQHDTHQSVVYVGNTAFGGNSVPIVAGPCSVESRSQVEAVAQTLLDSGIPVIRGGAFKPRTSPYNFQGMGVDGLKLLYNVAKAYDLDVISEVMSIEQIAVATPYVDCFQIGSRNMQNFELLKALGKQGKPVLLKRGFACTIDEFLNAAEYIMAGGNTNVILCERGIRSFDPQTRNVLDITSVALLKELTHLPVIVDPSHATGKRSLVLPASKAGVAIGADAIIVEAHPIPHESVSDAAQALSLEDLKHLVKVLAPIAVAVDRCILGQEIVPELRPEGVPQNTVLEESINEGPAQQETYAVHDVGSPAPEHTDPTFDSFEPTPSHSEPISAHTDEVVNQAEVVNILDSLKPADDIPLYNEITTGLNAIQKEKVGLPVNKLFDKKPVSDTTKTDDDETESSIPFASLKIYQ